MRDIILVGNGSSLLERTKGDEIDSYNKIVRFNSFKIKGFKDHVGSKTNVWFTVNRTHINRIHDFDEVYFHSWAREENCLLYADFLKFRSVEKIKQETIKETGMHNPSTGLIAIFHFLKEHRQIDLIGFDWWVRDKHHYGDDEKRGTLHDPKKELQIISKLKNVKMI
tara:strand:+ start:882 stop:1382 length:501 start_codon:yes stop_codon:yes gene_type:complete